MECITKQWIPAETTGCINTANKFKQFLDRVSKEVLKHNWELWKDPILFIITVISIEATGTGQLGPQKVVLLHP